MPNEIGCTKIKEEISYQIRFKGTAELSDRLDSSKYANITKAEFAVDSVEKRENGGEPEVIYKCKFTSHLELEQQGKKITAKDKTSHSQKLRKQLWFLAQEAGTDEELFYDGFMNKLRANLDEVILYLKNK